MTLRPILALLLMLPPTLAAAQKPVASPKPPKPAPELGQLKSFIGAWKCEGKQNATPLGPAHPITGSAQGRIEVDGFWYGFTYEEHKGKEHPGLKVVGLWGYDVSGKRFVRAAVSNQGGWDSGTSTGWQKPATAGLPTMVWTGEIAGPTGRMPFRHTFGKKSEREWTHTLEINMQGQWLSMNEVTCKR